FRSAMRFTLLLLLSMPAVVLAIQCLVGSGTSQDDTAAFSPKDCGAGEQYCYIRDIILFGTHTVDKGCGGDNCKKEGSNGDYECCKGYDFCNSAAGSSLFTVILMAAIASWLKN
ncbi:hypothetical protein PRIPAC_79651, partial [Pristionchus pacificus]|uniref:Uncharacterized protein n=1 Tax=Pristionchus pacificus TaxID=54126 RepID=A0A2A6CJP3_PRIPA